MCPDNLAPALPLQYSGAGRERPAGLEAGQLDVGGGHDRRTCHLLQHCCLH